MNQEQSTPRKQKLKIMLDDAHGEDLLAFERLVQILSERYYATKFKEKPLDLYSISTYDSLILISPNKPWENSETQAVLKYVQENGGTLIVFTLADRHPERINELLKPYGLSVSTIPVKEKQFSSEDLTGVEILDGIKSLDANRVYFEPNTSVTIDEEAEVVLRFKESALIAKRTMGKGMVYLISCLTVFGKKQLKQSENQKFLDNLLDYMGLPFKNRDITAVGIESQSSSEVATLNSSSSEVHVDKHIDKADVKVLLNELYNSDETVGSNAANTLMEMGESIIPYLKEVNKHIESDNEAVGAEIARILVHIGEPSVPSLIELLAATAAQAVLFKKKRVSIHRIIDILTRIGQPAIPGLRNELKSFDVDGKVAIAMVLQKIDYPTHEQAIIPILTKGLEAKLAYVRQWAIDTCMAVVPQISDPAQERAVTLALIKRFYDNDNYVREHAVEALIGIGESAVIPLLGFIEDVTETWYATHGPILTGGAGQLRRVVILEDAQIAADVLKGIGKPAVPKLVEVLKDTSVCESSRIAVALILGDIGDHDAVPFLCEVLDDEKEQVAKAATTAISKFGESAVPFLFKIVRSSHTRSLFDEQPQLAENLLVDTVGKAAVPFLITEIRELNEDGCKKAAELLGKIGDPTALPSLKEACSYHDEGVRKKAAKAIKKIEKK